MAKCKPHAMPNCPWCWEAAEAVKLRYTQAQLDAELAGLRMERDDLRTQIFAARIEAAGVAAMLRDQAKECRKYGDANRGKQLDTGADRLEKLTFGNTAKGGANG